MEQMTRAEARAAGLTRYYTGKPCKRGHVAERGVTDPHCVECSQEHRRKWKENNPEKARDAIRRWGENNQEKRRQYVRKWHRNNPEKVREGIHRRKERTAGRPCPNVCEACGHPPGGHGRWSVLHFDHDHTSGAFRGWLCRNCNIILGHADDRPEILRALADYLERTAVAV